MIRFTLNGASVEVQDGESRTLLEFLRNVRCMKGTKEACGTDTAARAASLWTAG